MLDKINIHAKIIILITLFALLAVAVLVRFVPTFGRADLECSQSIYRENSLHFNSLTRKEQIMYDAIERAISEHGDYTPEVPYVYSSDEFGRIVDCIIADCPQYFYVDYDKVVSFISETDTKVRITYFEDSQSASMLLDTLDKKIASVLSGMPSGSEFEKELYLHDWLVANCEYISSSDDNYLENTAYGAIVDGKALCDGYALAFKMLMNRAGIYCGTVSGRANGYSHMWNIVNIDGSFSYVDTTWDDSDLPQSDMKYHGYMNISSDTLALTHVITSPANLPETPPGCDYYTLIGHAASSREALTDLLVRLMTECADAGGRWFEISLDYEYGEDDLRNAFSDAVSIINNNGKYVFADAFRDKDCSENGKYKNIEIFYEVVK